MRPWIVVAVVLAAQPCASTAWADERAPGARAELSLDEVLRLYRESDKAEKVPSPPPVAATVDRITLDGRLLDHTVELTAAVSVSVLERDTWVSVPLLGMDESVSLNQLPTVENGTFFVDGGQLVFVARQQGRYTFELGLQVATESSDRARRATLEVAAAPLALLRLHYDETVFALPGHRRRADEDGVVLYPRDNRFVINWEERAARPVRVAETAPPAPLQPVVTRAVHDVVCTLEGRCHSRILYELRLNGAGALEIAVPPGRALERVYRNGVAVGFSEGEGSVTVEVLPFRSGDERGTLELVLSEPVTSYTLAGDLSFSSPPVSWPVHELFLVVHLPEVFTYSWTGGSLQPAAAPKGVSFSHLLPTPGSTLSFHQQLVSDSAPKVTMAYNIDLDGRYYRP